jgi:two-component system, OmpR family, KDP operon response regulator KdpE
MNAAAHIVALIVEDDFSIRRLLVERIVAHAMDAIEAGDLAAARDLLSAQKVDVILLDLGLPDGDGVAFIRELRAWSDVPVLVLSARHLERDKIAALDAGADDYLAKPFSTGELLARIRALTRRARAERSDAAIVCGDLGIDFAARRVTRAGIDVRLTPIELRVLTLLAAHPGKVLTYRQLLAEGWGSSHPDQHHYVRIVVGHLRRKLEADPTQPRHLLTETGIGYRWQS